MNIRTFQKVFVCAFLILSIWLLGSNFSTSYAQGSGFLQVHLVYDYPFPIQDTDVGEGIVVAVVNNGNPVMGPYTTDSDSIATIGAQFGTVTIEARPKQDFIQWVCKSTINFTKSQTVKVMCQIESILFLPKITP